MPNDLKPRILGKCLAKTPRKIAIKPPPRCPTPPPPTKTRATPKYPATDCSTPGKQRTGPQPGPRDAPQLPHPDASPTPQKNASPGRYPQTRQGHGDPKEAKRLEKDICGFVWNL